MDLILLVLPSLLFALLQHKSSAYSQEVESIQKGLEKFLHSHEVEEKRLKEGTGLKENLDAICAAKPRGIDGKLIWWFVGCLLLVSLWCCAITLGWNDDSFHSFDPADADTGLQITTESFFSVYMVGLAGVTGYQIWLISLEKKKIDTAYAAAVEQVKLLVSYEIG